MEKVIYEGRMSLKSQIFPLVLGTFFGVTALASLFMQPGLGVITFLIVLVVFIATPFLRAFSSAYKVTTERVPQRLGLIARNTSEVEVSDVRNVQIKQRPIARMLGIGDVGISTAGQSGFEIVFKGVADPQAVAELIRNARKKPKVSLPAEEPEAEQPPIYVIP
jgi:uncharacterized membrane protein YdbT with pleckstrin-like domain